MASDDQTREADARLADLDRIARDHDPGYGLPRGGDANARLIAVLLPLIEERDRLREDADMAAGCLGMVRDALAAIGCEHGPDSHRDTPPMMYPEWIACVVRSAVAAAGREAG